MPDEKLASDEHLLPPEEWEKVVAEAARERENPSEGEEEETP